MQLQDVLWHSKYSCYLTHGLSDMVSVVFRLYIYMPTQYCTKDFCQTFLSGVEQYSLDISFTHFESTPKYSYIQKNICALSHLALT